jgi:pyruvate kinase
VPILVCTNDAVVARRLQLVWGVRPFVIEENVQEVGEVVRLIDRRLLEAKLARIGDPLVILMGDPIRERPLTNLMRIHRVRKA